MNYRIKLPIEEIIELYVGGKSENAIANKYGVSRNVIRLRLEEKGVHIRSQSEAEALKWSQMDVKQRENQVRAAHEAAAGRTATREERVKRAIARMETPHFSSFEKRFLRVFQNKGIRVIPEYAFDIYNIDFALPEIKLAVEIDGGGWHDSKPKSRFDRGKEVLFAKRGWSYIRFQINHGKLVIKIKCADDRFIPVLNAVCSTPSLWCENGVVSSDSTT